MKTNVYSTLRFVLIVLFIILAIWFIHRFGVENLRGQIAQLGAWVPLGIFGLRFISVVIPAIPGTAYSALAGALLGFIQGAIVICLADLFSCSLSFYLSRQYGREFVQKLIGERFMNRVDRLTQQHLEGNLFLMSAFLMTGFFDFVCYAIGLTKTAWISFLPALILSIIISNPPIVALGAGILEGGKLLLGFAVLGMFVLALITGLVQSKWRQQSRS